MIDYERLAEAGYEGVLIENEYDQPHHVTSPPETTAAMTLVTRAIVNRQQQINGPAVGVEILLNDPKASMAVAAATGARFIRTDYFVDPMARPEYGGEMKIDAPGLIAYRSHLKAPVAILADIQVKYATMLEPDKPLEESARQAQAAGADGVIVSGEATGDAPITLDLQRACKAVPGFPVLIGSGLAPANAKQVLPHSRGAIVGTGIISDRAIDLNKARSLMALTREIRLAP
jgi:hypothetical protein